MPLIFKRRIALIFLSSAVHYFLSLFLLEHDLNDDIVDSYMKAENAIIFNHPDIYNQVELLVSYDGFIESNPEAIKKVLSALLEAQAFLLRNSSEPILLWRKSWALL